MNLDLQKKWPNNPRSLTAHQTHISLYNDILAINRVNVSSESTTSFPAEQVEHGVCFSIVYPMRVQVIKIKSCFMMCVIQWVNYSCLWWLQLAYFFSACSLTEMKPVAGILFTCLQVNVHIYTTFPIQSVCLTKFELWWQMTWAPW